MIQMHSRLSASSAVQIIFCGHTWYVLVQVRPQSSHIYTNIQPYNGYRNEAFGPLGLRDFGVQR